jgi:hypothetical protein
LISWTPPCPSLVSGSSLPLKGEGSGRGSGLRKMAMQPPPGDGQRPSPPLQGEGWSKRSGEGDREQAGWERAVPGAGGMARDTGTCSRARIEARNCSIRTLAPPALSTPAGGTRKPSAPPGTSLRNATHLNSRSCFVLPRIGTRVKVGSRRLPTGWLMPPAVFDAAAKPPILHILRLRQAYFRGSQACCCGAHKGTNSH